MTGSNSTLYRWIRQIGWFGVVGAMSTAIYAGTVAAAMEVLATGRQTANLFGLAMSSACSYLGHRYLTFKASGQHRTHLPRFAVQVGLTYAVASLSTYAVEELHWHYAFGIVVVAILIPATNFFALRTWVFVERHR